MDAAATMLGISSSRSVKYINYTLEVLSTTSRRLVVMPSTEELVDIEAGFFSVTGFPVVVSTITGTLIKIPRPHDFDGWYCREIFPAVDVTGLHVQVAILRVSYQKWLLIEVRRPPSFL